jgi:hypothetical protein
LFSPAEVLSSLRVFASLNLVLKIVLQLVAYGLTPEQLSSFRYEFQQIDTNHDGVIALPELLALGSVGDAPEIEALFYQLTVRQPTSAFGGRSDEPASISYSEFLAASICHRFDIAPERAVVAIDLLDPGSLVAPPPPSVGLTLSSPPQTRKGSSLQPPWFLIWDKTLTRAFSDRRLSS